MTSSGFREYSLDVAGQNNMSLAIEKIPIPATSRPMPPTGDERPARRLGRAGYEVLFKEME